MVNTELRRVKRLWLSAPTDSSLRRAQILVEDALRTASLSGAGGGRVFVVRSLKLGGISSHQSSAGLALVIEQAFYKLGCQAVHAEEPSASTCPVVYFKDEIEPYVCLALRLARGLSAAAWFWPLAVPFWRPQMARDEALRSLLGATLHTQAGVAAAVELVRGLFEYEAIEPLLSALRWHDGPALLQTCGWTPASLPLSFVEFTRSESVSQTPSRWEAPLATWIMRWGADDGRSNWLAATAIAADKPARLLDPRLMLIARHLIKLTTQSLQQPRAAEQNNLAETKANPQTRAPRSGPEGAVKETRLAETKAHLQTTAAQPSPEDAVEEARLAESLRTTAQLSGPEALEETKANPEAAAPTLGAEREARRADAPLTAKQSAIPSWVVSPTDARAYLEDRRLLENPGSRALDRDAFRLNSFPLASIREVRRAASNFSEDRQTAVEPKHPGEFSRPTDYAGLFFLIAILSKLGFSEMLEANPHLIEYNLPERFLSFVGERLGIPDDDPAISFLGAVGQRAEVSSVCEFIAPSIWVNSLCRRGPFVVCRARDKPLARTLCDSSEKLTLALWRGRAPEGVRALIGEAPLKRSLSLQSEDLQVLLESWLVAARRWCRRFAHVGLCDLVCRAGRVSQTRTHIDVLFEHRDADVRVRKAGLDLNPGWVAWLGHVVTFYYV